MHDLNIKICVYWQIRWYITAHISYNNTYHSSMKMKPVHVKSNALLTVVRKLMIKILNLK